MRTRPRSKMTVLITLSSIEGGQRGPPSEREARLSEQPAGCAEILTMFVLSGPAGGCPPVNATTRGARRNTSGSTPFLPEGGVWEGRERGAEDFRGPLLSTESRPDPRSTLGCGMSRWLRGLTSTRPATSPWLPGCPRSGEGSHLRDRDGSRPRCPWRRRAGRGHPDVRRAHPRCVQRFLRRSRS